MKNALLVAFLVSVLTACAPAITPTETILPTIALSSTPVSTSTLIPVTETPSPVPTDPIIPMITPDLIQVERWKEYQTELAKSILFNLPPEIVLCEWEILGRSEQEVYVWAVCEGWGGSPSSSVPALVNLEIDGSIQNIEIPGTDWSSDILRLFPSDVRGKFEYYNFGRAKEMSNHIEWRQTHPEEPPLIVLSSTPIP